MLELHIPHLELFNEDTYEITHIKEQTIMMEHSLLSISKWESEWEKPFLTDDKNKQLTTEEFIDYMKCMTITKNIDPNVYMFMTKDNLNKVTAYINKSHTATTVKQLNKSKKNTEGVTSELIYYWMTVYNIPHEYEKWHLNRLLTLIEVCNAKNQPEKKMPRGEQMRQQRALNEARKKRLHSRG